MVFSKHSTVFPTSLMTHPLDTIDEDSIGSTIPAFPRSKPSPVTNSPPILVTTSHRLIDTSSTATANWTTMTASPRTLPCGIRTHTTTVHDMLPAHSIRIRGTTPIVTIKDHTPDSDILLDRETQTYPCPTEPNYYVPLLDPPPPSTMVEYITHHLLDSIISDTMAQDPAHPNDNNNKPHANHPHTAQYSTTAQSTTTQLPSSQSDTTMNPANDNNDQPTPPSNNNTRDDHDRADRNNNNEQPNKRTKTATDPIDDIQVFSLRIPAERNLTETVYKIIEQLDDLAHDRRDAVYQKGLAIADAIRSETSLQGRMRRPMLARHEEQRQQREVIGRKAGRARTNRPLGGGVVRGGLTTTLTATVPTTTTTTDRQTTEEAEVREVAGGQRRMVEEQGAVPGGAEGHAHAHAHSHAGEQMQASLCSCVVQTAPPLRAFRALLNQPLT